ncbi:hypothetical protein V6N11_055317 [Hibiscus sabdariffa]|uniref:Uncharacterized protein n=1 Tax=Hibiscus sabdariffa TaxID=183260 RepID=A0ABR2PFN7_9ROSI
MDSSMCSSAPDPEMWIIQGTLAWRTSPVRTGLSLEHRFRFGLNGKIKWSPKHFVAYYALPRLWVPRSNCRIGKIGYYHIALFRLSSRVGDKRTRTADFRHRVNHRLSGPRLILP